MSINLIILPCTNSSHYYLGWDMLPSVARFIMSPISPDSEVYLLSNVLLAFMHHWPPFTGTHWPISAILVSEVSYAGGYLSPFLLFRSQVIHINILYCIITMGIIQAHPSSIVGIALNSTI